MRSKTAESLEMAEADFRTATREAAAEESHDHEAICFHAQQCAIDVRYPGRRADAQSAGDALADCAETRSVLGKLLSAPL